MITDELKVLVKGEAEKLKKYATPEELAKLNFIKLFFLHGTRCIYGQITGSCFSERAVELLKKCAEPYSRSLKKYTETNIKSFIQGQFRTVFSPIEFYIAQEGAKSKALIDFLKGKSKTLNL